MLKYLEHVGPKQYIFYKTYTERLTFTDSRVYKQTW
jgi:hypothetical protein